MRKYNIKIIFVCIVLLTGFIIGCQGLPFFNAPKKAYEIDPSVWTEWVAENEYADYANLHALFSDRTKFTTIAVPLDYANPSSGTLDVFQNSSNLGAGVFQSGKPEARTCQSC